MSFKLFKKEEDLHSVSLEDLRDLNTKINECISEIKSNLDSVTLSDTEKYDIQKILFQLFEENLKLDIYMYHRNVLIYLKHINTYLFVLLKDYRNFTQIYDNIRIKQQLNENILENQIDIDNKRFLILLLEEIINIYIDMIDMISKLLINDMSNSLKIKTKLYFENILKLLTELKQISTTEGGFKVKRIRVIRKY